MSKRVLILVEGQTEERFVKDVLAPYFFSLDTYFYPTLLVTRRVKDGPSFKGGVTSFAKFKADLSRLLNNAGDALVTTILDYYRLPNDFPGMCSRPINGNPWDRVNHVEQEAESYFKNQKYLAFLALHEFEAWLFSSAEELARVMTSREKQPEFKAIRDEFNTPEEINERPDCAPSKRIESLFPSYRKTLHGPTTAKRIGIDKIREKCPHFNRWIEKLERFAHE